VCINIDTMHHMKPVLDVRFFRTDAGAEPVREWLKDLSAIDRKTIGEDINTGAGTRSGQGQVETAEKEMSMGKKNIGSSFDDFLQEEAILEDATAVALKRVIAWQIAEEMKAQQITKTELAKRMHTSRAALNRLLDEADPSLTLTTLASAAAALGRKVNIQFAAT
jgi:DNA-binding Xre family transcriptional regulator